jgi:3-carboxy-cis,cis-muconate cycloisomerase
MSNPLAPSNLLTPLISSAAMRAIVDDRARLQRMLDVEVALARAQAAIGIIPALATDRIAEAAQAERYDLARLGEDAASDGDIARALVDALTAEIARTDPEATRFVHLGVSSQDIIDTALMLELRAAIDALTIDLNRAIDAFIALAGRHRRTAAVARTALRHALPAMRRRWRARASGSSACARRRWCCSSAASPEHWRRWASAACRFPNGSRRSSTCRCRRRPGTATATEWRRWRPRSRS